MPNNNPGGDNGTSSFEGFGGAESPYGAVKRLQTAQQAVPIGSAPGLTAPKQATRNSQKRSGSPQSPQSPPPTPDLSPDVWHAQSWAAIAADPEASDLVREIAATYTGRY